MKRVVSADGKREAEVQLKNNFDFDYIGEFYVGTPPQRLRGCFDTGSANSWLLSSDCQSPRCQPASKNQYFDPVGSSTFQMTEHRRSIMFGSGKLSGYFGRDDFRLGLAEDDIHVVG